MKEFPERDWKTMRKMSDELLEELAERILSLRRHGLLMDERLERLSDEGRELVQSTEARIEGLKKI